MKTLKIKCERGFIYDRLQEWLNNAGDKMERSPHPAPKPRVELIVEVEKCGVYPMPFEIHTSIPEEWVSDLKHYLGLDTVFNIMIDDRKYNPNYFGERPEREA